MSVSFNEIVQGLDRFGLKYHKVGPNEAIFGVTGNHGNSHRFAVGLEENGEYLDIWTVAWASCPKDHGALQGVLQALAHANYRYKAARFGWDPSDGEIRAMISLAIEDNSRVTTEQIRQLVGMIVQICDDFWPELQRALKGQPVKPPTEPTRPPRDDKSAQIGTVPTRMDPPQREPVRPQVTVQPVAQVPVPVPPSAPQTSSVNHLFGAGVLLLGIAAVFGVIYLFVK